jgi:hypothetical protein
LVTIRGTPIILPNKFPDFHSIIPNKVSDFNSIIPNTDYLPKMVTRVVSDSSFCLVPAGIIFLERSSGILYEAKIEQNWLL